MQIVTDAEVCEKKMKMKMKRPLVKSFPEVGKCYVRSKTEGKSTSANISELRGTISLMTENASCYLFLWLIAKRQRRTLPYLWSPRNTKTLIDVMNRVRNKRSVCYCDIANDLNAQLQRVCIAVCSKHSHDVDLMTPMKLKIWFGTILHVLFCSDFILRI